MIESPWRSDFPALARQVNGKPFAFLDSGASAQKPHSVIDALVHAVSDHYANIHRGLYFNSAHMTSAFEAVRGKVADFIGAQEREIVFTRNTTEAINLVAQSWGRTNLRQDDEIILTEMEHHANIVPWQLLSDQFGVRIRVIRVNKDGSLNRDALVENLNERTKLVAFAHISNVLGTVNPAREMIAQIKAYNPTIMTLIDASQSVVHQPVDVVDLGCDFLCFTGHKLYGPNGVGCLFGRYDLLETMPPYQGGGDMIEKVSFEGTTYKAPPARFEAGTPAISEVIALGAAIDYVKAIGFEAIMAHEQALSDQLHTMIADIDGATIHGTAPGKAGICSFSIRDVHPSDMATILDQSGVAVRTGHHCCDPLSAALNLPQGSIRASLGLYNDESDITQFETALKKAVSMLR